MKEELHNHSNDGIDNKEHILDMQKQLSMLIDNIKDNTDTAFSLLKLHENDGDQEIVDVYRINCSNILDYEKLAGKKEEEFNNIFKRLSSSADALSRMMELEDIFDEICEYEKLSEQSLKNLIELLKQS